MPQNLTGRAPIFFKRNRLQEGDAKALGPPHGLCFYLRWHRSAPKVAHPHCTLPFGKELLTVSLQTNTTQSPHTQLAASTGESGGRTRFCGDVFSPGTGGGAHRSSAVRPGLHTGVCLTTTPHKPRKHPAAPPLISSEIPGHRLGSQEFSWLTSHSSE